MRALFLRLMSLRTAPHALQGALLGLYAFSGWFYPPLNHLAILGLWILLLIQPNGRTWLCQHPLSRYVSIFLVLIGTLSIRGMLMNPAHVPLQILETIKWLLMPGFLAVAMGSTFSPNVSCRSGCSFFWA